MQKTELQPSWSATTLLGSPETKSRKQYLDYLRILATVFVIGVHTVSLASSMLDSSLLSYKLLEVFNFIFLSCNLLFIFISGALLLSVQKESAWIFYKKRVTKVFIPLVLYYVCYVCAKEGLLWLTPKYWLKMLVRIFSGAPEEAPHFWLIYVILWLYILTPFLRYLTKNISFGILRGLVFAIFIFHMIYLMLPDAGIFHVYYGIIERYVGIFLLGYYLSKVTEKKELCFWGICSVASLLCAVAVIFLVNDDSHYLYNNSPVMMFFTAGIFLTVKFIVKGKHPLPFILRMISKYSFSILLIHWGVLHFFVKQILGVSVLSGGIIGGCILMMLLTLVFSLLGAVVIDNTILKALQICVNKLLNIHPRHKA